MLNDLAKAMKALDGKKNAAAVIVWSSACESYVDMASFGLRHTSVSVASATFMDFHACCVFHMANICQHILQRHVASQQA